MSSLHKVNLLLSGIVALLALLYFLPQEDEYTPLTKLDASDVSSIMIEGKNRKLAFNKTGQQWRLQNTPDITIETQTISKLLGILKTHSYRQFENTENNRLAFELNTPLYKLTIDSLSVHFGITDPVQELRYVLLNNEIHLINDTYLQFLLADERYFHTKSDTQ